MVRIQLHLTERQDRLLRAMARRKRLARADLIRSGIDLFLEHETGDVDPLLALVGAAGPAGRTDGALRHDEIVYGSATSQPKVR